MRTSQLMGLKGHNHTSVSQFVMGPLYNYSLLAGTGKGQNLLCFQTLVGSNLIRIFLKWVVLESLAKI